eukprot:scaffold1716_cov32-Cyclotella_meneghiniana.AAC.1
MLGSWSGHCMPTVFVENRPAEVDEWEIFVFGRVGDAGANKEETEAAMAPPGELALALGVDVFEITAIVEK